MSGTRAKLIFVIALFAQVVAHVASNHRQIEIYDTRSISGSSFWVGSTNSIPSMDSFNIPELSKADEMLFCHEGVWMVHTFPDYFTPVPGPIDGSMSTIILHTNSGCDEPDFPVQGKSFRALSSTNTSKPTISLFDLPYMGGLISQYTEDVPNYVGSFFSIVVTSPGEVQLFTLPDFGGLSICLKPSAGHSTHWTWDITALGIMPMSIRSFKFYCNVEPGEIEIPTPTSTFQSSSSSFV